jgi:hypothetical protein
MIIAASVRVTMRFVQRNWRFALPAIAAVILLTAGCKKSNPVDPADTHPPAHVVGSACYPLPALSTVSIQDSVTGLTFTAYSSVRDTLCVDRLDLAAPAGLPGVVFTFTTLHSALLTLVHAQCDVQRLYAFGQSAPALDDPATGAAWYPLTTLTDSKPGRVFARPPSRFADSVAHTNYFFVLDIATAAQRAVEADAAEAAIVKRFCDSLPSYRSAIASRSTSAFKPIFDLAAGTYRSNAMARLSNSAIRPVIGWNADASRANHLQAHYILQMLWGDSVESAKEKLAPTDWSSGRARSSRGTLFEDLVCAMEATMFGSVGGADAISLPRKSGARPDAVDYPAIDGFACALVAAMQLRDSTVIDFEGKAAKFSPFGLRMEPLAKVMLQATTVEDLRSRLSSITDSISHRLTINVLCERLGWSYHAKGSAALFPQHTPLEGVGVEPDWSIDNSEFTLPSATSGSDGGYSLSRCFPDSSYARMRYSGKTLLLPVFCKWSIPTAVACQLSTGYFFGQDSLPSVDASSLFAALHATTTARVLLSGWMLDSNSENQGNGNHPFGIRTVPLPKREAWRLASGPRGLALGFLFRGDICWE